jgi:hypothetical protein
MTPQKNKVPVTITVDPGMLSKIDSDRGLVSRSAYLRHELEKSIR